jgi:hypothetical protein
MFLPVLSWLSFPGCPVLAVLSWLPCHGSLVLPVPFWLSYSSCPVLAFLFWLSCPGRIWMHEYEIMSAKIKERESTSANSKSAKNQGARERVSANAKAWNLRPKKERKSASAKSITEERESTSAKTKKSACPALDMRYFQFTISVNTLHHCSYILAPKFWVWPK